MLRALGLVFVALVFTGSSAVVVGDLAGGGESPIYVSPRPGVGEGPRIFRAERCDLCHSVSSAGIEARGSGRSEGPDLSGLGGRFGADRLARYLRREVEIDGKRHREGFKGSDEELAVLVDWLLEQ